MKSNFNLGRTSRIPPTEAEFWATAKWSTLRVRVATITPDAKLLLEVALIMMMRAKGSMQSDPSSLRVPPDCTLPDLFKSVNIMIHALSSVGVSVSFDDPRLAKARTVSPAMRDLVNESLGR